MDSTNNTSQTLNDLSSAQLATNFLGPRLISMFLQCLESGIIINQSIEYWSNVLDLDSEESQKHPEDGAGTETETRRKKMGLEARWEVKTIVAFVTVAGLFQTCVSGHDAWIQFIHNFANFRGALDVTWGMKMKPLMTAFMAAPVQAFLMWRCWILSRRNHLMTAVLVILWLGMIASSICVTIKVFRFNFIGVQTKVRDGQTNIPIDLFFLSSLAFPAVLDVCLTTILITFLLHSRSTVMTHHFRRLLTRFTVTAWEAALPPCICAIVAVSTYVALERKSLWNLVFQAALGQLYTISLLVTLNGFREARTREGYLYSIPNTVVGGHKRWLSNAQVVTRATSENEGRTSSSTLPPPSQSTITRPEIASSFRNFNS